MGNAASGINSPTARSEFSNAANLQISRAKQRVSDMMFKKEADYRVGKATETLTGLRDAAIISGQIGDADKSGSGLLNALADLGYIDQTERANMSQKFRDDIATGRLEFLPPHERIKELKNIKSYMHPDTYAKYYRQAEKDAIDYNAQSLVDDFMDEYDKSKNVSLGQFRDASMVAIEGKYGNRPDKADERAEAERRLNYEVDSRTRAHLEDQSFVFDKYSTPMITGKNDNGESYDFSMIPREDLKRMTFAQQSNLYNLQSARVAPVKVPWNGAAEFEMNRLIRTGRPQEAWEYFSENSAKMSEAQQKKWQETTLDGILPEYKSVFNINQTIKNKAPEIDDAALGMLNENITGWMFDQQQLTGKMPDDKARDEYIDSAIQEYDTSPGWFGTGMFAGNKPLYQMTEEEKVNAINILRDENDKNAEIYNDVVDDFHKLGIPLNNENILIKMRQLMELRNGSN